MRRYLNGILTSAVIAVLCALATVSTVAADTPLWIFDGAKWYSMMESGNVMVGTKTGVAMIDGANGKQIWTRSDLGEIKETEFTELSGTPLILFADNSGWLARKTKMTAVDTLTGATVWQTEKMFGYTAEIAPLYQKDILVFLTIKDNRINKDKPDIYALKMSTGELLWQNEDTEKVDLYGIEKKKRGGATAMLIGSGGGASDRFDLKVNPATKEIAWSNKYAAPGISGWEQIVMTALTVTAALMSEASKSRHLQSGDYNSAFKQNDKFLNLMSAYQQYMGKKYSAAKQSGNIYYVLTKIKGDDDSGSGLIGVNMLNGNGERQIVFNDKSPDYEVDELSGRLFNMNKGKLSAYSIVDKPEQKDVKDNDEEN